MKNKRVFMISLGCPKNRVDTELMLGRLLENGYELTGEIEEAEYIIVNTCAFIESARVEAVENILEAAQYKENGKCKVLAVTGCLPQRYADELFDQLPEVDVFLGTYDVPELCRLLEEAATKRNVCVNGKAEYLENAGSRVLSTPAHYAYIKIADGCSNRCSYCAIPSIRGPLTSRSMESVLAEAKELAEQGVRELILIAQDTTDYGVDRYGKRMLLPLCKEIEKIDGIEWIRILYMYPKGMTSELLEWMDNSAKACKYIDVPLQHINADIMRAMNRHDTPESVGKALGYVRKGKNEFVVRTSLIVGFPGETEEQFKELCAFLEEAKLDRVGAFTYSPEENTPAAEMEGQIDEAVKLRRYNELMEKQAQISARLNEERIGKIYDCIIDEFDDDVCLYIGRSQYEAPEVDGVIYVSSSAELTEGSIVPVRITQSSEYDLMGEVVEDEFT